LVQVAAKGPEGPDRLLVSLARHGYDVKRRADVNASCMGVNRR
jgi:hypothetical protein